MRLFILSFVLGLAAATLGPQDSNLRIVFKSRKYQRAGSSSPELWEIRPSDLRRARLSDPKQCAPNPPDAVTDDVIQWRHTMELKFAGKGRLPAWAPDGERLAFVDADYRQLLIVDVLFDKILAAVALPERSPRWNYPQSLSWSPDNRNILAGSEAGTSDSHFEEYWLLHIPSAKEMMFQSPPGAGLNRRDWRYAGGGNEARWSPGGSQIVWSTPRSLAPLGRIHVWVVHLVLVDVATLRQQVLTSGLSYESDHAWCESRVSGA